MSATTYSTPTEILGRVIDLQNPSFTREAAQSVLELHFPPRDGRATIDVLRINLTYRITVRASLIDEKIRP